MSGLCHSSGLLCHLSVTSVPFCSVQQCSIFVPLGLLEVELYCLRVVAVYWLLCSHTEKEVEDETFYLTQLQSTDTGPMSPSADHMISFRVANVVPNLSRWYDLTQKDFHSESRNLTLVCRSQGRRLNHSANEAVLLERGGEHLLCS